MPGRALTRAASPPPEDVEQARSVKEIRERPGVRGRVADLTRSPDPWVREAATLALEEMDR